MACFNARHFSAKKFHSCVSSVSIFYYFRRQQGGGSSYQNGIQVLNRLGSPIIGCQVLNLSDRAAQAKQKIASFNPVGRGRVRPRSHSARQRRRTFTRVGVRRRRTSTRVIADRLICRCGIQMNVKACEQNKMSIVKKCLNG